MKPRRPGLQPLDCALEARQTRVPGGHTGSNRPGDRGSAAESGTAIHSSDSSVERSDHAGAVLADCLWAGT